MICLILEYQMNFKAPMMQKDYLFNIIKKYVLSNSFLFNNLLNLKNLRSYNTEIVMLEYQIPI